MIPLRLRFANVAFFLFLKTFFSNLVRIASIVYAVLLNFRELQLEISFDFFKAALNVRYLNKF
jgi:hypothetical protein